MQLCDAFTSSPCLHRKHSRAFCVSAPYHRQQHKINEYRPKWGPGVAYWLRRYATSPGGVTGDFFHGSFPQNHVPWGRLSLWKWVPGISPAVKAAGAYDWRPTTLVVPNVEMIRGLNLPGTPRATSACRGTPLLFLSSKILLWRIHIDDKTVLV